MDKHHLSERDICNKFIEPTLLRARRRHQFRNEVSVRKDGVTIQGKQPGRVENPNAKGGLKRENLLLYVHPNVPNAVVAAKQTTFSVSHGMRQARSYAEMLDASFASTSSDGSSLLNDCAGWIEPTERELSLAESPKSRKLWPFCHKWPPLIEPTVIKLVGIRSTRTKVERHLLQPVLRTKHSLKRSNRSRPDVKSGFVIKDKTI